LDGTTGVVKQVSRGGRPTCAASSGVSQLFAGVFRMLTGIPMDESTWDCSPHKDRGRLKRVFKRVRRALTPLPA